MVNVKIDAAKGKIEIKGHANSAPKGQDIICASVSTITECLIIYFDDLIEKEKKQKDRATKIKKEDGFVEIKYNNKNLSTMFMIGHYIKCFQQWESQFPNNIKLEIILDDRKKVKVAP